MLTWVLCLFLLLWVTVGCLQWRSQRRDWNNGISSKSGRPWRFFDMDSQGGRGYTDGCGNYLWLDWFRSENADKSRGDAPTARGEHE